MQLFKTNYFNQKLLYIIQANLQISTNKQANKNNKNQKQLNMIHSQNERIELASEYREENVTISDFDLKKKQILEFNA